MQYILVYVKHTSLINIVQEIKSHLNLCVLLAHIQNVRYVVTAYTDLRSYWAETSYITWPIRSTCY